jgi:outer membrane protein TolC
MVACPLLLKVKRFSPAEAPHFQAPRLFPLICLMLFSATPGWAEPSGDSPGPPALQPLLETAVSRHPALSAAHARYEAAARRITQAGRLPDPRLSVTWFAENIQTRTGEQEATYALAQPIPWPGKLARLRDVAQADATVMHLALRERQLELLQNLATRYYQYAGLGQRMELTRQSIALLRKLEPVVQENVRGGARVNELLRLQVETQTEENELLQLRRQRHALSAQIRALQGRPRAEMLDWPRVAAPPNESFQLSSLLQKAQDRNPSLLRLQALTTSSLARAAVARVAGYPEFSVGLTYIQTGEARNPLTPGSGEDPWGINFSVTIPWDRSQYRAREREARAETAAARADYADALNSLEANLQAALARWELSREMIRNFDTHLLPDARQALEMTENAFRAGESNLTDVIDSQRALITLRQSYRQTVTRAWVARVNILALTGVPLSETPTSHPTSK